jgi:hypothetical protein
MKQTPIIIYLKTKKISNKSTKRDTNNLEVVPIQLTTTRKKVKSTNTLHEVNLTASTKIVQKVLKKIKNHAIITLLVVLQIIVEILLYKKRT